MTTLILKLIIAHLVGDFVLQPNTWVEDKKKRKYKSPYLYYHIAVHALAVTVLLQFDFKYWVAIITTIVTHFLIDVFKLNLQHKLSDKLLFGLDQIAHLSVIAVIVAIYEPYNIPIGVLYKTEVLIIILAVLCVTYVSAIIMKLIMSTWVLSEDDSQDSLEQAGKYIGMLERLFVFAFIVMSQWQAIGFLIAAKSVFRFGDLSKAKDRKLTEYILIGTLLSFGLAFLIGMGYRYLSYQI